MQSYCAETRFQPLFVYSHIKSPMHRIQRNKIMASNITKAEKDRDGQIKRELLKKKNPSKVRQMAGKK